MCTSWDLPTNSAVEAGKVAIGADLQIGDDVRIQCDELVIGNHVRIGVRTLENFRSSAGVRIVARRLVLADNVTIDRASLLKGGDIVIAAGTILCPGITINVKRSLNIGREGVIREGAELTGVELAIGNGCWLGPNSRIGGGSAFETPSRFTVGDSFHLGAGGFLNSARAITIGNEVGLGSGTALYTHGAYTSMLAGAPVSFAPIIIEDRVWCPGATVNPGVTIGHDAVVAVGSVVTRNIPAGALAAGIPAKVIREGAFPRILSPEERRALMSNFLRGFAEVCSDQHEVDYQEQGDILMVKLDQQWRVAYHGPSADPRAAPMGLGSGVQDIIMADRLPTEGLPQTGSLWIDLERKELHGPATPVSERLRNQLRRYGVRFGYSSVGGSYLRWPEGE